MERVHAEYSASVSELKKNPSALIERAGDSVVAILNHNCPTAYLIPAAAYEVLLEKLENYELTCLVKARESEEKHAVKVSIDDL